MNPERKKYFRNNILLAFGALFCVLLIPLLISKCERQKNPADSKTVIIVEENTEKSSKRGSAGASRRKTGKDSLGQGDDKKHKPSRNQKEAYHRDYHSEYFGEDGQLSDKNN